MSKKVGKIKVIKLLMKNFQAIAKNGII